MYRTYFLFTLYFSITSYTWSEEQPLYELGVIGSTFYLPHYRGADEYNHQVLPLPYFVYRGDFFKSRDGKLSLGLDRDRWSYGLSFFVSPPPNSDSSARSGMDDLGAILEVGPALTYTWLKKDDLSSFHSVRTRVSTALPDFKARYAGLQVELLTGTKIKLTHKSTLSTNFRILYGNKKRHDYFYGVGTEDARADRPFYEAEAGFSGSAWDIAYKRKIKEKQSFISFFRLDNINGAEFRSSPLVKRDWNISFGFLYIYKLYKSSKSTHSSF